ESMRNPPSLGGTVVIVLNLITFYPLRNRALSRQISALFACGFRQVFRLRRTVQAVQFASRCYLGVRGSNQCQFHLPDTGIDAAGQLGTCDVSINLRAHRRLLSMDWAESPLVPGVALVRSQ